MKADRREISGRFSFDMKQKTAVHSTEFLLGIITHEGRKRYMNPVDEKITAYNN